MDIDERTDWESDIKVIKPFSENYRYKVYFFDEKKIAHEFNSLFTNVGRNLASKIPNLSTYSNTL